jgi:hypothetical protein
MFGLLRSVNIVGFYTLLHCYCFRDVLFLTRHLYFITVVLLFKLLSTVVFKLYIMCCTDTHTCQFYSTAIGENTVVLVLNLLSTVVFKLYMLNWYTHTCQFYSAAIAENTYGISRFTWVGRFTPPSPQTSVIMCMEKV